jgi:hypothetical protein
MAAIPRVSGVVAAHKRKEEEELSFSPASVSKRTNAPSRHIVEWVLLEPVLVILALRDSRSPDVVQGYEEPLPLDVANDDSRVHRPSPLQKLAISLSVGPAASRPPV